MRQDLRTVILNIVLSLGPTAALASGSHGSHHGEAPVGEPEKLVRLTRTVQIDMTDNMRFTPAQITVTQGETIRFVVKNSGQLKHEMVIGTSEELKEHYAAMLRMPTMEHADENQVTVAPGETGEVVWSFSKAGAVDFACLRPGHFDAGMKGSVQVTRAAALETIRHRDHRK